MPDKDPKEVTQAEEQSELGSSSTALANRDNPLVAMVLEAFPDNVRGQLKLTESQVQLIIANAQDAATGLTNSLPMICKKDDCDFKSLCIFHSMGIAPEGARCPEEILFIQHTVPQLIESMSIDTEDALELDMLREYMGAAVQERRAQRILALDGDLGQRVSAVDQKTGTPFFETVVHPIQQVHDKAKREKRKLRQDFLATREMRAKYKKGGELDDSQRISSTRSRMESAQQAEDASFEEVPEEYREDKDQE